MKVRTPRTPGCLASRAMQKQLHARREAQAGQPVQDLQREKRPGQMVGQKLPPIVAGDTSPAPDKSTPVARRTATWHHTNHGKEPCANRASSPIAQNSAPPIQVPEAAYPASP